MEFVTGTTHRAGDSLEHSMKQGLVRFAGMLLTSAYNRYVLFNPFNVVEHCLSLLLCDFNALFEFNCCLHYKQSLFLLVKKKKKRSRGKRGQGMVGLDTHLTSSFRAVISFPNAFIYLISFFSPFPLQELGRGMWDCSWVTVVLNHFLSFFFLFSNNLVCK